jgi:hypothetical protein
LIADTFAAAGWHQDECIAAIHHMMNRVALQSAKRRKPKRFVEYVLGCHDPGTKQAKVFWFFFSKKNTSLRRRRNRHAA